jgi:predicted outer membrane protein
MRWGWTAGFLLCAAALATACVTHGLAQEQGSAKVMILGTYHFANPGLDYVKSELDDHLSERRQKQIADVVALLAQFKPTKIAVESLPETAEVQANFEAFLKGEYTLTADESEQIGFRLAKQFGHARIHQIDHRQGLDIGAVLAAAERSGNGAFLEFFQKTIAQVQALQKRQASMTVRESLVAYNEPQMLAKARDIYLQMARVRSGQDFVGADVLATWHQRNFRIFANLAAIIASPEDRVLVIYGSGHAPILRQMVESSPDMRLVEPSEYLK